MDYIYSAIASQHSTVSIFISRPLVYRPVYHITGLLPSPPSNIATTHSRPLQCQSSPQMCRLLAAKLFLRCHHIQPCHLKHPLQRCHAPRGQRFRNPDAATLLEPATGADGPSGAPVILRRRRRTSRKKSSRGRRRRHSSCREVSAVGQAAVAVRELS